MPAPLLAPTRRPFPLPADVAADLSRSVTRACTGWALQEIRGIQQGTAADIVARTWPNDHVAVALAANQRAATAPATTVTTGWAAELTQTPTGAFLAGLQMASAAQQLFASCLRLSLDGYAALAVPYASPTPSLGPSFTAEGAPIPARQAGFTTVTLGPNRALRVLCALTNELADHSVPTAEAVVRQVLTEAAALVLDTAVFSAVSGDATRPPGLLNGVTPIGAATGGGAGAAVADIGAMVAAIASAGGGRRLMLFLPPGKAVTLPMLSPGVVATNLELVPAPTLSTTVIMVDPGGVMSAYGGDPVIETAVATTIHFDDTNPQHIGTVGTPNVVAAPSRSMFQTDSYALRLRLPCAWAAKPGFVQVVSGITW